MLRKAETEDDLFLVVAPNGRDGEVVGQLLDSAAIDHVQDPEGERFLSAIRSGGAACAVLTDDVLATISIDRLQDSVERQPPWSDFPVILLVRRGETRMGTRLVDDLLNVTILERPLHPASLISTARSALRTRRRQRLGARHLGERERARSELRDLADTLEAKVEARTRDLAERTVERDRTWNNSQDLLTVIGADGVIRAANPAWERLAGWDPDELVGRHYRVFRHSNEPDVGDPTADAPLSNYVSRVRCKDGGYRTISWVATREGDSIYASGRDITSERAAAEALQLAESRIKAVFATTRLLQGYTDADGQLLDANPASLAAIGADRADVVGRPFWDTPWFAQTPGMAERVELLVREAATGALVEQDVTINLPEGPRSFEFSLRPVTDAAGAVIGIIPEALDITERRQTEAALRQAQKMEAVGQLTGGIAHDFNNLLAGIMGNLELMTLRIAQGRGDRIDRFVTAAQGAAQRAAALTQRLLAFSRRQTLDPKPTNINRLIAGMEELVRRSVGPAVAIEVVGADDLWPALVDPGQVENALLNLCINGRDAMPDGGTLTIETANTRIDEQGARQHNLAGGHYVSLCVTDSGTGMPPEVIARAFDPFYTTKPIGQGTGLGLSMIYGFARQSGGQVRIDSEVGEGTTVRIYLPRFRGEASEPAADTSERVVPDAGGGATVLVVDDEPTVRDLIDEVLSELGYTIIGAADGAAGLKVLETPARIDLLVTDVGLPGGMNGRQVADAARILRPGLKVLFITGYADNAAVGNGQLDPGMALLTKPFALDMLTRRIEELVQAD